MDEYIIIGVCRARDHFGLSEQRQSALNPIDLTLLLYCVCKSFVAQCLPCKFRRWHSSTRRFAVKRLDDIVSSDIFRHLYDFIRIRICVHNFADRYFVSAEKVME